MGWKFLFAKYSDKDIDTKEKWFEFIDQNDGRIFDEYGEGISAAALKDFILLKQEEKMTAFNCFELCGCSKSCAHGDRHETIDSDGFRISDHWDFI